MKGRQVLKALDNSLIAIEVQRREGLYSDVRIADVVLVGRQVIKFRPGDRIVLAKYSGRQFHYEGKDYIEFKNHEIERDIIALIESVY